MDTALLLASVVAGVGPGAACKDAHLQGVVRGQAQCATGTLLISLPLKLPPAAACLSEPNSFTTSTFVLFFLPLLQGLIKA